MVVKVYSLPFFLCFSNFNFKTLILRLEVGRRFKTLNNQRNS